MYPYHGRLQILNYKLHRGTYPSANFAEGYVLGNFVLLK